MMASFKISSRALMLLRNTLLFLLSLTGVFVKCLEKLLDARLAARFSIKKAQCLNDVNLRTQIRLKRCRYFNNV